MAEQLGCGEIIEPVARVIFVMCENSWHSPDHRRCQEIARAAIAAHKAALTAAGYAILRAPPEAIVDLASI